MLVIDIIDEIRDGFFFLCQGKTFFPPSLRAEYFLTTGPTIRKYAREPFTPGYISIISSLFGSIRCLYRTPPILRQPLKTVQFRRQTTVYVRTCRVNCRVQLCDNRNRYDRKRATARDSDGFMFFHFFFSLTCNTDAPKSK